MGAPEQWPIRLTVTADDLGLCSSVNRSIAEAARGQLLQTASLMVNMPSADEAVQKIAETPLTLGLHFTLTSGRCGAPPKTIPLLADAEGRFRLGFLGLARLLASGLRDEALEQIRTELAAQISRFDQFRTAYPNVRFDHIDSHQHIHVFSELFELLAAEANKRSLHLRIPHEPLGAWKRLFFPTTAFHYKGLVKKAILDHCLSNPKRQKNLTIEPSVYFGVIDSGRMTGGAILKILDLLPKYARQTNRRAFEINLHPWRIDEADFHPPEFLSEADQTFCRSAARRDEWDTLTQSAPIIEKMRSLGIIVSAFQL